MEQTAEISIENSGYHAIFIHCHVPHRLVSMPCCSQLVVAVNIVYIFVQFVNFYHSNVSFVLV